MNISIYFGNQLMAQAIQHLLGRNGYDAVVVSGKSPAEVLTPDVLLIDSTTLTQDLLATYSDARVLLIDTDAAPEQVCAALLSHRIHGVLPPHAELPLFKKALTAVSEGKLWIDNEAVNTLPRDAGNISQKGKISHGSNREQQIIDCICQGFSNREIARSLVLSEHTVKAHLNKIFKKLNIRRRSQLLSLTMQGRQATSV